MKLNSVTCSTSGIILILRVHMDSYTVVLFLNELVV